MRIKAEILKSFIDKVTLQSGKGIVMNNIMLDFGSSGVLCEQMDIPNIAATQGVLENSAFESYDNIGKIGILDTKKFCKKLATFNGDVEIKKEESDLKIFNETRFVTHRLAEECKCEKVFPDISKMKAQINTDISIELLEIISEDVGITGSMGVTFEADNGKLSATVIEESGENPITNEYVIKDKGKVKTAISGDYLTKIAAAFSSEEKVKVMMADDNPVIFIVEGQDYKIKALVAPRIEKKEKGKK